MPQRPVSLTEGKAGGDGICLADKGYMGGILGRHALVGSPKVISPSIWVAD